MALQVCSIRPAKIASALCLLFSSLVSAQSASISQQNDVSLRNGTAYVDRRTQVNRPWGKIPGVLQFRGNPMRNYYGEALPGFEDQMLQAPSLVWQFPKQGQGVLSSVSGIKASGTNTWVGTGWTGQPVIWQRPDTKVWEVIVGAFDRKVHFLNALTGEPTRKPFEAGDLVKGSVTLDPDGFPILYFGAVGDGSQDGFYRALALDREPVQEIWKMHANEMAPVGGYKYSRDWDGNASIINDHLIIGAEIGWILGWKLNRGYNSAGLVSVSPRMMLQMNSELPEITRRHALAGETHRTTGIESSCAADGNILYCANGQGRVMGVDLSQIDQRLQAKVVFDFWAGDDVDSSPVVDENGHLYLAVEHERLNSQNEVVGQLLKLDPSRVKIDPKTGQPDPFDLSPIVWNRHYRGRMQTAVGEDYSRLGQKGGFWATPVLDMKRKVLYVPSHLGDLLAIDTQKGDLLWSDRVGYMTWSSPNLVGDVLIVGLCTGAGLSGYDVSNPKEKRKLWSVKSPDGGCVESSAAVFNNQIFVGTRAGHIFSFGWK